MPFIPHTDDDIREMLEQIGVDTVDQLFDEIPTALHCGHLGLPPALTEMETARLMETRARQDEPYLNFIGAGAYEHHIPAAVWQITSRGEFYTAYTPYQAEASQGTLQTLYEFQTMIAALTAMDVANASLYDGASALAEAVLMTVRMHKHARRILLPATVHPFWRQTVQNIVKHQQIELVTVSYDHNGGHTPLEAVTTEANGSFAALVISQPNFFGRLEAVDELTDWAHQQDMAVIATVNPIALGLLKPPGEWGKQGADIVVGEGQPLGAPLTSGGPYFGFMSCKRALVRQMPGRLVGRTVDMTGREGFTLTLQAREQHIRRGKATSNICTNQGLMVTAAAIHMALLGPKGTACTAAACHDNTSRLMTKLAAVAGIRLIFTQPFFHEAVFTSDIPAAELLRALAAQGILGGFSLGDAYPELENAILVCATETKTEADLDRYVEQVERIVSRRRREPACSRLKPTTGSQW